MAINIAAKRARKAQHRKQVQAEKRKQEAFENSLPEQVQRTLDRPIRSCLLNGTLMDLGLGTMILARGTTPYNLTLAVFLIDTFRGVKDVFLRSVTKQEFDRYMGSIDGVELMREVDPAYARKLLRDLTAHVRSLGFAPHRDFAVIERMFGDVDANACDVDFGFGRANVPRQVSGPEAA